MLDSLSSNALPDTRAGTLGASTSPAVSRGDAFLLEITRRLCRLGSLTPRMSEALALHVEGWPQDVAAREMGCSKNTYRNHLASAMRRVGADAPSELFRVLARDLDAHANDASLRVAMPV